MRSEAFAERDQPPRVSTPGGRSGKTLGPPTRQVELAGDGEQRVADGLAFEPAAGHPAEERVVGVVCRGSSAAGVLDWR